MHVVNILQRCFLSIKGTCVMEKLQLLISDYIYDITDVGSKTDTYIVLQVSSFSEIYTKTRISFVNDSNERTSSEYPQCNSDLIVKRKLKQSWSIIPPNINILNNHLPPQMMIQNRSWHMNAYNPIFIHLKMKVDKIVQIKLPSFDISNK